MPSTTVTLEFYIDLTWEDATYVPDILCQASAEVHPDDGVGFFDDIKVSGTTAVSEFRWLTPPEWLYRAIMAHLESGAEDERFEEAARDQAAGERTYAREMMGD